ncbi:MAG: tRNA uridine-5-carboxymethylaminomethyl(34) synthesis GTPase MnmE [Planctomycetota bacterium]|nr:MAG: tRNA uridine-5-carboxymethylaminomethyl(34) synthesis GTPase MnmE [Planctomycetota bacterium]
MKPQADWIAAVATPPGAAERAVIRLSGAGLLDAADALLPPRCPRPRGRREARAGLLEWSAGCCVPVAVLVFPQPASATGEDVLELHLPGCAPVVDAVLEQLCARGLRPAQPGEFTRRAFLRGRLDLAQAEAVLALVQARSAASARAAAAVLAGSLGAQAAAAREALGAALTELEAGLDFEEGDAADLRPSEVSDLLQRAADAVAEGLRGEAQRRVQAPGPRIGLWGAPNAGKTSLFRALTGVEALVSAQAGTTRDCLEAPWQPEPADAPWILVDGPGVGAPAVDPRDAAARARAAGQAPLALYWLVVDSSSPCARVPQPPAEQHVLVVWTHADLPRQAPDAELERAEALGSNVWVSSRDGRGLADLARATAAELRGAEDAQDGAQAAAERHHAALQAAAGAVAAARRLHRGGGPSDLVAEEIRSALSALAELVGRLSPEDLLDRIFARFCVGK